MHCAAAAALACAAALAALASGGKATAGPCDRARLRLFAPLPLALRGGGRAPPRPRGGTLEDALAGPVGGSTGGVLPGRDASSRAGAYRMDVRVGRRRA